MCDPGTLLALTAASTVMATVGTGLAAYQGAQQSKYAGKVAGMNAKAESARAHDAIDRGKIEQQQHWRKVAQLKGQQQAAMAANGIDTSFGSAALLAEDTAMFGAEDADTIYKNTLREVQGIDMSAANFRSQQQAARQAQSGAIVGGVFGMASTALSGASQYATLKVKMGGPAAGGGSITSSGTLPKTFGGS